MLDIKFIRKNPDKVKEACKNKKINDDIVDRFLDVDKKRREILKALEDMRAKKNKASLEIQRVKSKKEKEVIILKMQELDRNNDRLQTNFQELDKEFQDLIYEIPNTVLDDVPVGKDENDNKVIRKWGKPTKFDFKPKDHILLGQELDIIDTEIAAKVSGSRFGYLKGGAALLEVALIQHAFEVLTSKEIINKIANSVKEGYSDKIFIPVVPPVMIRPEVFRKMARLSEQDRDERYYLPQDDLYLIGSAEHTLGSMHMDEAFEEKDLPIRYLGFSTSFRREAGSYGKDTKGILRVHQFDKLEIESFTLPENSLLEQEFIVAIQGYLMQSLKIPYQVVMICTGEMSKPDARQVDIEAWLPGQGRYRETHTSDLMTDYQARRLNTRVKRLNGEIEFVHMNDATAFAIGRTLIAIIENYQQKDGSIKIPEVLQKYLPFKEIRR